MNRSRGSQELAIRTDIDVSLSVVGEFVTGEHAIGPSCFSSGNSNAMPMQVLEESATRFRVGQGLSVLPQFSTEPLTKARRYPGSSATTSPRQANLAAHCSHISEAYPNTHTALRAPDNLVLGVRSQIKRKKACKEH